MKKSSLISGFTALLLVALGVWIAPYLKSWTKGRTLARAASEPPTAISPVETPKPESRVCRDLFEVACHRRDITNDPTGAVEPDIKGEVDALRIYEELIHQHPSWDSDQVDDALVSTLYTAQRRKRLQDTFHWVRARMLAFIDRQPSSTFSAAEKAELRGNISTTELQLPPPASVYSDEPDLFTKNEIYYSTLPDGKRIIRIGGAYLLTAKSWFNRVFTFSHELAHSIDPCEMQNAKIHLVSYDRLTQCFLDEQVIHKGWSYKECDESNQLSEAFADWMAAKITAEALLQYREKFQPSDMSNSVINAVRDLCNEETWLEDDDESYPEPRIRIGVVFGKYPAILDLLQCPKSAYNSNYCTFDGKGS